MTTNSDNISKEDQQIVDAYFNFNNNQQYAKAVAILNPLAKKYPNEHKIFFLLGMTLYQQQLYQETKKYLKKATQLNPEHELSSMTLFHTLCNLGEWHSAFSELRRFLALSTTSLKGEHLLVLREMTMNMDPFSTSEKQLLNELRKRFLSGWPSPTKV